MKSRSFFNVYRKTSIRLFSLTLFSLLLVLVIPYAGPEQESFFSSLSANIGVLYAIIIGFIMSLTLSRKETLDDHISLELNKVRRIYHIALHLKLANPKLKRWFDQLTKNIEGYLKAFKKIDFLQYEKSDILFRKVGYSIYSLPSHHLDYDAPLYESLLATASEATEAREYIRAKKDDHIGQFLWVVLLIVTLTFSVAMIATTDSGEINRFAVFGIIFNVFLVLGLIYEYDFSNEKKDQYISNLYVKNMTKIYHPDMKEYDLDWEI